MEKLCEGNGPIVGTKLSLADVTLFVLINDYFDNKQGAQDALRGCPKLRASVDAVGTTAAIATYLTQRPLTPV